MKRLEIKNAYIVVKRLGGSTQDKEGLVSDGAARLPIFFKEYDAIKYAKRTPKSIVRKVNFDLFDWSVSNIGQTIYIDPILINQ